MGQHRPTPKPACVRAHTLYLPVRADIREENREMADSTLRRISADDVHAVSLSGLNTGVIRRYPAVGGIAHPQARVGMSVTPRKSSHPWDGEEGKRKHQAVEPVVGPAVAVASLPYFPKRSTPMAVAVMKVCSGCARHLHADACRYLFSRMGQLRPTPKPVCVKSHAPCKCP